MGKGSKRSKFSRTSSVFNHENSSGRPTLLRVVYTYYVALLLIIGASLIFVSYAGFLALHGISVVAIQLFYLIPGYWGILHDLMGFRTIFFILQGGLCIPDIAWSIVAFVQLNFAIGTALCLCGLVQAFFFLVAYFNPYILWPKFLNKLLISSLNKQEDKDKETRASTSSATLNTNNWVETEFSVNYNEDVPSCQFQDVSVEMGQRHRSSTDEPDFPQTILLNQDGQQQVQYMKPASISQENDAKSMRPRIDSNSTIS
ncbi:unnamed protein product [Bursaphelenchus okinawaensis]|uniref:Uncharacterized protein n=1 Tax=Bursaphelenchus okinawaensis TaxID=465554 RepID=A0A811L5F5_9BILA|nr:unnamed protein product [Bursaphelenchus okinawaensis]CAG9118024.1 unnamed protein product [Bursaphelenchus okinawaensis]